MKTLRKSLLLITVIIFGTVLVSWNHLTYSTKEVNASSNRYLHERDLNLSEVNALIADDEFNFSPEQDQAAPPAEDVLIQKLPSDNNHLLIMAFYSKENYSGKFISIENGGHLVFRDDGNGYDKKA